MKFIKKTACLMLTILLFTAIMTPVMASSDITVEIDGQQIAFDVPPTIINNRTMVPLRAIFEALGATVNWNGNTRTVTSTKGNTTIRLTINDSKMYVNDKPVSLDSPACIVNDRTLVPVRAISEAFGTVVSWDEKTQTVTISAGEWYTTGMYRVGSDIPAGDYYAVADEDSRMGGYYCKYTDGTQNDIEDNEIFDTFTFFRCYNGQYLKIDQCKITAIENAPINTPQNGIFSKGMYRVGIDMPAGEYKFTSASGDSGYYCAYTDITLNDIENNDIFEGSTYYVVQTGQFLKIDNAQAERVGNGNINQSKETITEENTDAVAQLVNYIVTKGLKSNGYKKIQANVSDCVATITYRDDLEYLIFHLKGPNNGSSTTVSFDYDIKKANIVSEIGTSYMDNQFTMITSAPINMKSYTIDTELTFKKSVDTESIFKFPTNYNETSNMLAHLGMAGWEYLLQSKLGFGLREIGFSKISF